MAKRAELVGFDPHDLMAFRETLRPEERDDFDDHVYSLMGHSDASEEEIAEARRLLEEWKRRSHAPGVAERN